MLRRKMQACVFVFCFFGWVGELQSLTLFSFCKSQTLLCHCSIDCHISNRPPCLCTWPTSFQFCYIEHVHYPILCFLLTDQSAVLWGQSVSTLCLCCEWMSASINVIYGHRVFVCVCVCVWACNMTVWLLWKLNELKRRRDKRKKTGKQCLGGEVRWGTFKRTIIVMLCSVAHTKTEDSLGSGTES